MKFIVSFCEIFNLKNENINNNFRDSRLGVASYMKDLIDGNI